MLAGENQFIQLSANRLFMFIAKVMIYFFGAKQTGWNTCNIRRPEKTIDISIWVKRIKFN